MTEQKELVTFTIDGKQITVPKGTMVWTATQTLGIDIPIFCYQDRMPPFGACRVCLVEVEKMPKLQTSCTLEATEGMVVHTQSTAAIQARDEILEFLLINHPLDCPICDRGGECPLQDQAYKFGPGKSRFFEDKRRFVKPITLGPVLTLDRERCIACARCTRFGDSISGDHALEFIERGYKTEVGTCDGKAPRSKFIGNTIMICPVGALTSSVYRFRARPWDNESTKTTCTLCPVGCQMFLDSRDGEIMRTRSCENRAVNDIWLCDKGWFGYEFSSSKERLTTPLIRKEGALQPVSWDEAFSYVAAMMTQAKPSGKLGAFGGCVLTVEEQYLLQKLFRDILKTSHLDHRIGMPIFDLDEEGASSGMEMEIGDIETLSHVVLLGLDITEEFPVLWLRMKQAINKGAKILFCGYFSPEVAKYFEKTVLHAPQDTLQVLYDNDALICEYLNHPASALFVGRHYVHSGNRAEIVEKLSIWKNTFPNVPFNILDAEENSLGARMGGMHPELLPGEIPATHKGMNAKELLTTAAISGWEFLYVVGCNPAKKYPSSFWSDARKKISCLVVQDLFLTETALQADVVLPTLCFTEKGGSFLNIERRVQKLRPAKPHSRKKIPQGAFSDAYIFIRIAQKLGAVLIIDELILEKLQENRRIKNTQFFKPIAHIKQKNTSTCTATFAKALFDEGTRMQHNEHLIQLTKEARVMICPQDAEKLHLKKDTLVTIANDTGTFDAILSIRSGIASGTVVIPLGSLFIDGKNAYELGTNLLHGLDITIQQKT